MQRQIAVTAATLRIDNAMQTVNVLVDKRLHTSERASGSLTLWIVLVAGLIVGNMN
jgi:hypothetical protein